MRWPRKALRRRSFPLPVTLLAGVATAGLLGIVVGLTSLRVRHDFLAVTTMGIGFVFLGFVRKQRWLGGELGISGIPDAGMAPLAYALLIACFAALVIALSLWLKRSWMGFTFDAVADDVARPRRAEPNGGLGDFFGFGHAVGGVGGVEGGLAAGQGPDRLAPRRFGHPAQPGDPGLGIPGPTLCPVSIS